MFSFIKKSGSGGGGTSGNGGATSIDKEEKERRKKEKKERKEKEKKEKSSMTADDLLRLDEVRRSLKLRGRRKDKEKEKLPSGITADYTANFFGDMSRNLLTQTSNLNGFNAAATLDSPLDSFDSNLSTSTSKAATLQPVTSQQLQQRALPLPPLPPRAPKKVTIKSNFRHSISSEAVDPATLKNVADISPYRSNSLRTNSSSALNEDTVDFKSNFNADSDLHLMPPPVYVSNYDKCSAKSPSIESLTDSTTNSSFATPPFSSSPVGEGQGYYSRFSTVLVNSSPEDPVSDFPLPDIEPAPLPKAREVLIQRRPPPRNDFGFSIRRVISVCRNSGVCQLKSVILAEMNTGDGNFEEVGLLPGDQLLEVNGVSVEDKSREEITDLIKTSDSSVKIKVQPLPELSELSRRYRSDGTSVELDDTNIKCGTLRRSGSKRFKHSKGKSDEQLQNEKTWLDCERLWLMHKSGFTAVRLLSRSHDSGKVGICLEATGEQATVDEDDVELANPAQFDQCEDLSQLRYLNESSALHTLRQRYASNLIHTYAGPTMVIVNPMVPLNIYTDKVAQMFRGCKPEDMPAHVFSLAQSAYRDMLTSRRDHSIVFIGRSGSGKTTNYKHVLQYLVLTASSSNKILNYEKLNAIWTILEAFGNARTSLNNNATRFTHLFSLDFDHAGQIVSSSIQIFSCEKWRLVRRSESEHAFHILYKMLAGVDGTLRKELALDQISASEQNIFFTPLQKNEEKQRALMDFTRICAALKTAGISETEQKTIFMILAAIIHLGYAGTSKVGTNSRWQFNNPAAAQRAAKCLGTTVEELSRAIFTQGVSTPTSVVRNTYRNTSPTDSTKSMVTDELTGLDALEGFVVGLYVEVFNLVGSYINRNISANVHTVCSIIVLDSPGFQNPASCGQLQDGASFNDLCHNYFQERLQSLFHYMNLDLPRERYNQEHIEVTLDKYEEGSPEPIVSLLDNSSASFLRSSQCDLRQSPSTDKRAPGLLWLLDDNSSLQPATEHYFVDKIFSLYGDREDQLLIRKAPGNNHFVIQHCQGTNPVLYRADGWLKQCKENPFIKVAITILQDSNNKDISNAFASCRGVGLTSSVATLDCSTHSLRRVSSIRRTFNAGFKRKSVSLQVKFNIDGIIETLRRTRVKFAHCFLPHHDAGLMDKSGGNSLVSSSLTSHDTAINVPLLRSQLRGSEVLPVVRLNKQGFPKSMSLAEFKRRFMLLSNADGAAMSATGDDQSTVKNILLDADVDESSYRIGLSEVFFRSGVLTQLEALRDDKLADRVIKFQAYCRGYLSRKRLAKLKIEDVAIRCIQRNVRKFMLVRDWPWWRLLVRITPLLNVHRTEQELKTKTEELEALRAQCDKLEQERNTLKQENAKLDAKLSELSVDLAEEHSAANLASERLELETAERMRLENEVQHLQSEKKKLQESSEKLETELLCMKTAEVNGIIGIDDDDSLSIGDDNSTGSGGVYKQRYERALRELEYTKRRLQQQHHDDLEQLIALRKQLEKKIADAYEEVEEQRQVVAQWKRKVQKLNGEMSDLRLMLEDSNSRNNLLEKKQRKFDSELLLLQEELRQEKQNRERVIREKDIVSAEKYTLEQNFSALKVDMELKEQKLLNLNRELQEISYGGNTEEEISRLRKVKHELENRITEQDEELDDLAGQVELLNQAKLRLQMDLEQSRKEHKKELNQRDDESEKIRLNTTKKVKALECQLENEHEERTMLLRERHELERKLAEIEDRERCNRSADMETVNRLRRDLKKTKILLHDAQLMLQQAKLDAPSKAILRQLRNQLEDAECARNVAVKARQMAEADLADITSMLEDVQKAKSDAEEKATLYAREKSQLQSQLDENEEELAEVLKKYRNTVQQLSNEQLILHEQANRIAELESERSSLKDQLAEVTSRLENIETHGDPTSSLTVKRLELKTKELESKLDLEQTTRSRIEVQIGRLKEAAERLQHDADIARSKEASAQENVRKLQRALRDAREAQSNYESKEATESARKRELEKKVEQLETELSSAKADLKLALQRVDDLQCAIQGDLDDNDDDQTDSDNDDSGSSNASLQSFLLQSNGDTSIHKWLNNGSAGSENSKI